jgi:hypothetical protein
MNQTQLAELDALTAQVADKVAAKTERKRGLAANRQLEEDFEIKKKILESKLAALEDCSDLDEEFVNPACSEVLIKPPPRPRPPVTILAWDGLRGYYSLIVILAHLHFCSNAWILIGFFFSFSGLIVTNMTLRVYFKKGDVSIFQFYHRRIARLIPAVMLLLICICFGVAAVTIFRPQQLNGEDLYWLRKDMLWYN